MLGVPSAPPGSGCRIIVGFTLVCLGCGDMQPMPPPATAPDSAAPAYDAAPDAPDTAAEDALIPACPGAELDATGLALGVSDPDGCFARLAPGETLAIVHGIQGGIHVEIRIAAHGLDVGEGRIGFEVDLVAAGASLARFASEVGELRALIDGESYATPAFPLIFPSPDATLYHGREAELRAAVTLSGQRYTLPIVPVLLEDPLLVFP